MVSETPESSASGEQEVKLPKEWEKLMDRMIDDVFAMFRELGGPDDELLQFTIKWDTKKKVWIIRFKGIEAIHNSKYQLTFYY